MPFLEEKFSVTQKWVAVYHYLITGQDIELFKLTFKPLPSFPLFETVILGESDREIWRSISHSFKKDVYRNLIQMNIESTFTRYGNVLSEDIDISKEGKLKKIHKIPFYSFTFGNKSEILNSDILHIIMWHKHSIYPQIIVRLLFDIICDQDKCPKFRAVELLHYIFNWIKYFPDDFKQTQSHYFIKAIKTVLKTLMSHLDNEEDKRMSCNLHKIVKCIYSNQIEIIYNYYQDIFADYDVEIDES